jgi:hypothetical protein
LRRSRSVSMFLHKLVMIAVAMASLRLLRGTAARPSELGDCNKKGDVSSGAGFGVIDWSRGGADRVSVCISF